MAPVSTKLATGDRWFNQFSEFFLAGSSVFTDARTESLGRIYDPTTAEVDQDLVFTYTTVFGDVITGLVVYDEMPVTIVENADFDNDGDVDGGDFLIWQRGYQVGVTQSEEMRTEISMWIRMI
ncbi:MAG: hypothetical protein ABGX16_19330 [Pirellulales bacterium]